MARQVLVVALIVFTHGILLVAGQTVACDTSTNVCANGGTCLTNNTCTCAAGYTGDLCGTDINECAGDPCQNLGTCEDEVAGYTCNCDDDWAGTNCDLEACATGNECENGGTCEDKTCSCATGYTGDFCGTDIDECASNPCQETEVCKDEVAGYTCTCEAGWTGTNCDSDINECASNPCQETEVCKDEVAGYTCAVACDETETGCANGGTCEANKTCSCAIGYAGDLCDSVACDNTVNVCANDGTCEADKTCTCVEGYTGDLCDDDSGASLSTASCLILALALALTKMATD